MDNNNVIATEIEEKQVSSPKDRLTAYAEGMNKVLQEKEQTQEAENKEG